MGREQGHLTPRPVLLHHSLWVPMQLAKCQGEDTACYRRSVR